MAMATATVTPTDPRDVVVARLKKYFRKKYRYSNDLEQTQMVVDVDPEDGPIYRKVDLSYTCRPTAIGISRDQNKEFQDLIAELKRIDVAKGWITPSDHTSVLEYAQFLLDEIKRE